MEQGGGTLSMLLFILAAVGGLALLVGRGFSLRPRAPRAPRRAPLATALAASIGVSLVLGTMLYLNEAPASSSAATSEPLLVYCAAALKTPLEAIKDDYEREFGRKVVLQFGSSESLLTSIKLTRKGDIYIPADSSYLSAAPGVTAETIPLVEMTPVIAVEKGNPRHVRGIGDLTGGKCKVVLAAGGAAIGKVTRQALNGAGKWQDFERNMRGGATISEVGTVVEAANAVKIGSADAAFIWDAMAPQYPSLEIVHDPLFDQAISSITLGVLQASRNPTEALHFSRYIAASDRGLVTLAKLGYRVAAGDAWEEQPVLKVFSGSMLRPAVEKTLQAFEAREGVRIDRAYNGCGILVARMKAGDKPDLYFASDSSFMAQVYAMFDQPTTVSKNDIVIAVKKGNPQQIHGLKDLAEKKIRIGVGHERQGALGMLTRKNLDSSGMCEAILKHVVVQSPTGDFLVNQLRTGALDAAIVYYSNVLNFGDIEAIKIDAPIKQAVQPVAVLKNSRNKHTVERLKAALMSQASHERFNAAGFYWALKP